MSLWQSAAMDDQKLKAQIDQDFTSLRTAMTILFSDIKGSTKFAEKRGDVEYMSMHRPA